MRRFLALLVAVALPCFAAEPDLSQWLVGGAPISTVSVSTTSASTPALSGGTCYRVACSTAVLFRTGVLPLTALTTDNYLPANWVERVCLRSGYNGVAFVTSAGTGTCTVNSYASAP